MNDFSGKQFGPCTPLSADINTIEPIIKIAESDEPDTDRLFEHLRNAVHAWNFWIEIQDRIKKFVEENS